MMWRAVTAFASPDAFAELYYSALIFSLCVLNA